MELRRRVTIFVPAFNEVAGLESAVRGIAATAADAVETFEVLIVDDGSTDGTGALADRLAAEDRRVRAVHHPCNLGLKEGYETALGLASLEYFTFIPGDNEVSAESIVKILGAIGTADIVLPYHFNSWDRPWHRRLMTWTCTTMLNRLLGNRIRYYQGPAVYPTALARILPRNTRGFFFLTEMMANALSLGYTVAEVGLIHCERSQGRSKAVKLSNILKALATIGRLWWMLSFRRRRLSVPPSVPRPSGMRRPSDARLAAPASTGRSLS